MGVEPTAFFRCESSSHEVGLNSNNGGGRHGRLSTRFSESLGAAQPRLPSTRKNYSTSPWAQRPNSVSFDSQELSQLASASPRLLQSFSRFFCHSTRKVRTPPQGFIPQNLTLRHKVSYLSSYLSIAVKVQSTPSFPMALTTHNPSNPIARRWNAIGSYLITHIPAIPRSP